LSAAGEHLDELRALVADLAELDPATLGVDTAFRDVDIDSLLAMEIAVHVEKRFGVRFTDGDIARIVSIRDLAALVAERGGAVS
jgi:acyl carrier protein